jgi:hypothetical protein
MNPLQLLGAASGVNAMLVGQLVFSVAFIGGCELPNWIVGPRQTNVCLERWYVVTALFFPSAAQGQTSTIIAEVDKRRRNIFGSDS